MGNRIKSKSLWFKMKVFNACYRLLNLYKWTVVFPRNKRALLQAPSCTSPNHIPLDYVMLLAMIQVLHVCFPPDAQCECVLCCAMLLRYCVNWVRSHRLICSRVKAATFSSRITNSHKSGQVGKLAGCLFMVDSNSQKH